MLEDIAHNKCEDDISSANVLRVDIDKGLFTKNLYYVQSVVEKRNIIPVLSYALLSVKKKSISITATDMDIVVSSKIAVDTDSEGEFLVAASMLYDIIRKFDGKSKICLIFDQLRSLVSICSSDSRFNLPTLPVKDFPKIQNYEYKYSFKLNSNILIKLLDQCKISISNEETRYNLNGINVELFEKEIRFAATDGHRLSVASSTADIDIPDFVPIIIPKKTVTEIRKILDDIDDQVNIDVSNNRIRFYNSYFSLTSKLVEGVFPKYQSLIPSEHINIFDVATDILFAAIDRVATITNEKFSGVNLTVQESNLEIYAASNVGSNAKEKIKIKSNISSKIEIGFNYRYILEGIKAAESDTIRFALKGPFDSALITNPNQDKNSSFQYILMPMRV